MPVTTQFFEVEDGQKLAYTDYGGSDGDLVLALPGMGALRSEYRFLAPELVKAGYHAVSVDLRGQGESSNGFSTYDVVSVGGDILALIEHLNSNRTSKKAHVIATSFSPAAAVWAAVEAPDKIQSLVLIGAFCRDPPTNPVMKLVLWLMFVGPWNVQAWKAFYPSMYPTRKPDDFEDYMKELVETLQGRGKFDAVKAYASASRKPSEERLPKVTAPTLVVMGSADPDFPDAKNEAEYLVAQIPGAKLAMIEGGGHYPQSELPEQTNPEIIKFLSLI